MANSDPRTFRAEGDRRLAVDMLLHPRVKDAIAAVAAAKEAGRVPQVRRMLLAQALRLGASVAPNLHASVDACKERLGIAEPIECYVHPSADYNAGIYAPEDGRLLIMFTAALIEGFETVELRFVVGHELGHHVFGHHDIPVAVLFDPQFPIPAPLALQVSAWQRYAEISADRAGLACCGSFDGAARGLFKLASGLRSAPTEPQVLAFLEQARELGATAADEPRSVGSHQDEWFSSHPFSPLRIEAAHLFSQSVHMGGSESADSLEVRVADLMAVMEPGYLDADTEAAEAMRRLVYAAGIVLASLDGGITKGELRRLDGLLGPSTVPSEPDVDRLKALVPERTAAVLARTGLGQRAHIVRDLATLALADGTVSANEQRYLCQFAKDLGVAESVATSALAQNLELD